MFRILKKSGWLLFLPGIFLIMMLGCNKNEIGTRQVNPLLLCKWMLSYIQDTRTMQIINYPANYPVKESIEFTNDSTMAFYGTCNGGRAEYSIQNNQIIISNLCTTLIFCSYYKWENYLRNNLDSAYSYDVSVQALKIYSKGSYNLYFVRDK
ncbi:MAG: META domain-containing protein [Bacteroidota bacterium]|nr:META domain-containing protein [Bacteroidota bacterium]MDP4228524.1 META domain-containing protein [Bacteroidota bacterium]MDP4274062.1 META domain-containing protein [Bacteroidota bacterium]